MDDERYWEEGQEKQQIQGKETWQDSQQVRKESEQYVVQEPGRQSEEPLYDERQMENTYNGYHTEAEWTVEEQEPWWRRGLLSREHGASILLLTIIIIFIAQGTMLRINNDMISIIVTQFLIVAPAFVYMAVLKQNPFKYIRFRKFHIGSAFLIPLLVVCLVPVIGVLNALTMLFTTPTIGTTVNDIMGGNLLIGLLLVAVLPAFVEETTFRGALYHSIRGARPVRAIFLSALMFGAMHMNFNQFVYATALGIIMGFLLEATGSIVATMLLHLCFNGNSVILLWLMTKLTDMIEDMDVDMSVYEQALEQSSNASLSTPEIMMALCILIPMAVVGGALAFLLYYAIAKLNKRWYYICFLFSKSTKEQRVSYPKPRILYITTIICFIICLGMCILAELQARGLILQ